MGKSLEARDGGMPTKPSLVDNKPPLPTTREAFFQRLTPVDDQAVSAIIHAVNGLADNFNSEEYGNAFFAVYAVGGMVTKNGERPDIDLLVVTNAHFGTGYYGNLPDVRYTHPDYKAIMARYDDRAGRRVSEGYNCDWIAGTLQEQFEENGYRAQLLEGLFLPEDYIDGVGKKGLLRLTPLEEEGWPERKPIDVIIVHPVYDAAENGLMMLEWAIDDAFEDVRADESNKLIDARNEILREVYSLKGFEKADVDSNGVPLPRILLFKAEQLGREAPPLHW